MSATEQAELELALLAEAVYAYQRYAAYGISPEHYESPTHQAIAQAAQSAWELGATGLDAVCVELQRAGRLARLDGKIGLHRLLASSRAAPDAHMFRDRRRCRLVRDAALKAAIAAERHDLTAALAAIHEATGAVAETGRTITGAECAERTLTSVKENAGKYIHPGLEPLERCIGSLPAGSLTIVAAHTSVGKSTICLETLLAACDRNVCVGYVSREDPDDVVGSRLLGSLAGVSSAAIQSGGAFQNRMEDLSRAVGRLKHYGDRLLVDNMCGGTEMDTVAAMSRMAARGAKLIAVDYIQNIESSRKQQDRRNEIRAMTSLLKGHAQRLGVALILVSQLSRPMKGKENAEPSKHDLKEAGDLENSAEVVIMLWRGKEEDDAIVNVKIAKCKWGGVSQQFAMKRNSAMRLVEYRGP